MSLWLGLTLLTGLLAGGTAPPDQRSAAAGPGRYGAGDRAPRFSWVGWSKRPLQTDRGV